MDEYADHIRWVVKCGVVEAVRSFLLTLNGDGSMPTRPRWRYLSKSQKIDRS